MKNFMSLSIKVIVMNYTVCNGNLADILIQMLKKLIFHNFLYHRFSVL
ncbi:hypothetical protein SAMN05421542_4192 [Chryseobacterium jejuense]|uniref:Uncharacterized protein n=1 Tax=Chryseobacterium jejuense TaxID=445960 RepID=A0A2X2VD54_CHRJE|nr:hypothetical protein SAMN05421542_4192 [Chryseobacterium jejuense]SQB26478.1 Uncharacterised protein [Chryseobacterium jejuense]